MSPNAGHSPGLGRTWALGRGRRLKLRREPHIVKSAVYACSDVAAGPARAAAGRRPTKSRRVGISGRGAKFPAPGFEFPARDQIRALKFPARLRSEFCKKTMQYQRISHTPFA